MSTPIGNRQGTKFVFYGIVAAIVLVVWLTQAPGPFFSPKSTMPTEWQQLGVNIASETTRLLATLGTAMLGALGLLVGDRRAGKLRRLSAAFACAASAGLS